MITFFGVDITILWFGGRSAGTFGFEKDCPIRDEWVNRGTWRFWRVARCTSSTYLDAVLKLQVTGPKASKGRRYYPQVAHVSLGFGHDYATPYHFPQTVDLGKAKVRSLREAQTWADSRVSPEALRQLYQSYYNQAQTYLIESFDHQLGWYENFTRFDMADNPVYGTFRVTNPDGKMSLVETRSWTSTRSWPNLWERLEQDHLAP